MTIRLEIDELRLKGVKEEILGELLEAGMGTLRKVTRELELELEALTKAAVPGNAYRAWNSHVYPRSGRSYRPVGEVFVATGPRSQGMARYWTQPGTNRAKGGQWLAIPTPAAGPKNRAQELTPGEWERRTGIRLQFVFKGGKYAFLVASGTAAKNKSGALRALTKGRVAQGRQRETVVVFVLIREQPHANRVSIEGAVRRAVDRIDSEFGEQLRRAKDNRVA